MDKRLLYLLASFATIIVFVSFLLVYTSLKTVTEKTPNRLDFAAPNAVTTSVYGNVVNIHHTSNSVSGNNIKSTKATSVNKNSHKSVWVTVNGWLAGIAGYGTSLIGYLLKHVNS